MSSGASRFHRYLGATVACFVVHYGHHACWFVAAGDTCEPGSVALRVAKGAGMALNLNFALVALTMCRSLLTWLRETWVTEMLPLDLSYSFHMTVGWAIVAWTVVHVAAHYVRYFGREGGLEPKECVTTSVGAQGHVILFCIVLMAVTAHPSIRRARWFHIFFGVHHLFIVVIMLLCTGVHGKNFRLYFTVPVFLYVVDRLHRMFVTDRKHEVAVVRCERLEGKVTHLEFEKPDRFRRKPPLPGQYVFVAVPSISSLEFHPFTLSSAPSEDTLSLHIRSVGDWTGSLHAKASPGGTDPYSNEHVATVLVDGPYGAPAQELFDYEVAVMVGAGIGVTPFASVLKEVRHKLETLRNANLDMAKLTPILECFTSGGKKVRLRKLYFYWTTRQAGAFEWFGDLLRKVESSNDDEDDDAEGGGGGGGDDDWSLEVCTYITSAKALGKQEDLGSMFLQLGLDLVRKHTGHSLLTGNNKSTKFARPDWDEIFEELQRKHAGKTVGVFFCGPERLGNILRVQCREFTEEGGTKFSFHKEIF